MTSYVEIVSRDYPTQYRCRHCGVVVRRNVGGWVDGAGYETCPPTRWRQHKGVQVPTS